MAADLNSIANRNKIRGTSKEIQRSSRMPMELKVKPKHSLAHRPTGRPPHMAWAEQETKKERYFPERAEVCEL